MPLAQMFLLKQLAPAALVAGAVAAAVSALALVSRKVGVQQAIAGFALALGYFAGHWFVTGWPGFPPTDTTNWLPYFALAEAVVGLVLLLVRRRPVRLLIVGVVATAAMRLLVQPKFRYVWSSTRGWIIVVCLSLAVMLVAFAVGGLMRRSSLRFEPPLLLLIVCGGTSAALLLSGSILLGQFAVVLAAAVAGAFVVAIRETITGEALALVFSLVLVALLVSGYFFAELPAASAILLAAAPCLALIPMKFVVRVALVSLPVAIALFLAFRASPPLDY